MPGWNKSFLKASEDYYDTVKRDLRILEAEQLNLRTDADALVTRQIKIRRLAKTAIFALAAVFAVFLISMTLVQNDSDTALFYRNIFICSNSCSWNVCFIKGY